jgi:glutaminyl-peptide cyclotransferase
LSEQVLIIVFEEISLSLKVGLSRIGSGTFGRERALTCFLGKSGTATCVTELPSMTFGNRLPVLALIAWPLVPGSGAQAQVSVQMYGYQVVHAYPHDTHAFTEGLFYLNGFLYESTGLERESSIRKVRLETGEVVQKIDVPAQYFGEGIVNWKTHLVSLTWKSGIGFVYDLATLKVQHRFSYPGEGWALTQDGKRLIMSDGTPQLRFLDPVTLKETGRLSVTYNGAAVSSINELEWGKGKIYANVWQTNVLIIIDPVSGIVTGVVNLAGLLSPSEQPPGPDGVLNGIAYDARHDRLFVTGKNWSKLFEIRVVPKGQVSKSKR